MAYTTEQWYSKIQKFIPSWWFQEGAVISPAEFMAIAAVFQAIQVDCDDQQKQAFITKAVGNFLDVLGWERSIYRNLGELDGPYSVRIQNGLFTPVSGAELQALVNGVLNNGPAFFIENWQYGFFDDDQDEFYYDDPSGQVRWIDGRKWYDWWTVIVPIQTGGSDSAIQAAIVAVVEANKALGTTYDVLYGSTSDTDTED